MCARTARGSRRGRGRRCWHWRRIGSGLLARWGGRGPRRGERRAGHDPGRVLCDLAVMLADGGRCVSDLVALASQPALFGEVASVSTARRVMLSIGEDELGRVRAARAQARERAWT